ncbi:MAG: hypothetical protein QM778_05610 [Myxococcales bacterium]
MTRSHPLPNLAPRWPLGIALALSLLLHATFGFVASTVLTAPSLDIEFQLPMDVEFGASEQMALAPSAAGSQTTPPPGEASPKPETGEAEATDAGAPPEPKPKPKPKPKLESDAGLESNGEAPPGAAGNGSETRIPAGAQIAVRVDMARIRKSPLADDVRQLLAAIPDWRALLDGSGIDPIEQLDRFMIATPNLQRSKIVVAGRYEGGEQTVLDAVEKLAAAHGASPGWHAQLGVRVATWANLDETPRVIALVGPSHFTISREEDLARVLAFAATRAQTQQKKRRPPEPAEPLPPHPADALLSMEDSEGLSVEVEGAEQFVRRAAKGVPSKLRLSAVELPGPRVELRGRLVFADPDKAAIGAAFWDNLRNVYSRNALVAMLGLAEPLQQGTIRQEGAEVTLTVGLSLEQTRLILGYLRELVRPPPTPSSNASPSPIPAAP